MYSSNFAKNELIPRVPVKSLLISTLETSFRGFLIVVVATGTAAFAQQVIQVSSPAQPEIVEGLRNINESLQKVQSSTISVQVNQPVQSIDILSQVSSVPPASGKTQSNIVTWNDNRGSFRLEFPSGKVCSLGNSDKESFESCN